ncbi:energy-coupling factor ABC transporter ATP-binding protein [Hippea jasoniae]|uniref:energy-coupling factor ABC transporter ATP-binding protein n=1 Tax=Hippea jasoniae TaxID=944479 RepID=UPI00054E8580|nr:ABC transporter ATP-binding protein [Hippea jasoniae]
MENIFELENVSFSYFDSIKALDDISFSIREGLCTAILGANGCGKSTLLKILDGLYFAESGQVKAFGKQLSQKIFKDRKFNEFFRKKVGFVFQDPDSQLFLPTVKDEIALAFNQFGYDSDKTNEKVFEIASQLNLSDLLDKYPFNLSEGEKRKVSIASVYALNPDVWLIDEPIAFLDPKTQWWVVDMLKKLKSNKKTIVIATHNLRLVEMIADYCVVIGENHRLLTMGKTKDILADAELLIKANIIHPLGVL